MMKLYHSPQSRSVRPKWLLEEIGAPYEVVKLDLQAQDQKKPEYLKLNPKPGSAMIKVAVLNTEKNASRPRLRRS